MANYIRTIATLKGAEEPLCSIRRIFDTAIVAEMAQEAGKSYRHEDGLLWQIIPMPPGLMDIESDGYVSDLAKGRSLESVLKKIESTRIRRGGTPDEYESTKTNARAAAALRRQYGYPDWFSWANANWNVKWDAGNISLISEEPEKLVFRFDTAWSFPLPPMKLLSRMYPELILDFEAADEDIQAGRYMHIIIHNGDQLPAFNRKEHDIKDMAAKVWGYRDFADFESQSEA